MGAASLPLFIGHSVGITLLAPASIMMKRNKHWASSQGYSGGTTLDLPWPPFGTNSIAIQVLDKCILGVLLTAGFKPETLSKVKS